MSEFILSWFCRTSSSSRRLGAYLLKLLYPAPQAVHLHALVAALRLQLRDALFLLGAMQLQLLHGRTQGAQLLLQGRHVLLLLVGRSVVVKF